MDSEAWGGVRVQRGGEGGGLIEGGVRARERERHVRPLDAHTCVRVRAQTVAEEVTTTPPPPQSVRVNSKVL